jgi:hypothetical protein
MQTPTVTKDGIVEALSATVRPDIRPPGTGTCTCPPGTLYAACTCAWGVAIDRLLQLGYSRGADPVTLARELPDLGAYVQGVASAARKHAITTLARDWTASAAKFARMLGIGYPALQSAAPAAVRMILERRGTR